MANKIAITIPGFSPIQGPTEIPQDIGQHGEKLFTIGIQLLFVFAILFALVIIILSGISWITSGGDKQKLQQARSRAIYAIVGLVVALAAFFIVNLVGTIFGVKLIGN